MTGITDFLKVGSGVPRGIGKAVGLATPAAGGAGSLQKVLDILGSKGGQTAVNAIGAGVGAYGASKDAAANRELTAAGMAQRQLEGDRSHQLSQATAAAGASPLGAEQQFAQKQALAKALLGGARNFSATPGDAAVAGAMGSMSGGMRLPEGGFDPAMLERLFGDEATMASLAQRGKMVGQINPGGPAMSLAPMFGARGDAMTADVSSANVSALQQQSADAARQRELIMRAIDQDVRGTRQPQPKPKGDGNIFGTILKGVGAGASLIPGVGQIISPIATGLGGIVNGDGVKRALIGAGMSAIPGMAAAGKFGTNAARVAKNPITTAILGGRG